MRVATGISDHYGQAEFVTVSMPHRTPVILDRRRAALIAPGLPLAPYHHEGLAMPLDEVKPLIARTRDSIVEHCRTALSELQSSFGVEAIVIQESPYQKLPESIAEVLESYAMTCAADGMLYREALADEASRLGIEVRRTPRKSDPVKAASKALRCSESKMVTILDGFGKKVGSPWRKEHKHAAAAALGVLAGGGS